MALTYHTNGYRARGGSGLVVLAVLAEHKHEGRTYKLLSVQTKEGLPYVCLRLYNATGRFIKQFLFEREVAEWLKGALSSGVLELLPASASPAQGVTPDTSKQEGLCVTNPL